MKLAQVLDSIVDRIERAKMLDGLSDAIASVSEKVLKPGAVTDLASGTPLGHPVHPLLVALPIGAWSSALVFDLMGRREAAQGAIGIGLLTAVPTMFAGHSDWAFTSGAERRVGTVHAALNNLAFWSYASSWLARRRGRQTTGVVLALTGVGFLSAAGWLGGHLAYAMGVGVDTTVFQHGPEEWTRAAAETEVAYGQLTGVEVDGVPVLLTRDASGGVVALADRCTHRGAPLHEGELRDGCVVCPWHASSFDLHGQVTRGPATRPQPTYETEVRDGDVYVRRPDETRTLRANPVGH